MMTDEELKLYYQNAKEYMNYKYRKQFRKNIANLINKERIGK